MSGKRNAVALLGAIALFLAALLFALHRAEDKLPALPARGSNDATQSSEPAIDAAAAVAATSSLRREAETDASTAGPKPERAQKASIQATKSPPAANETSSPDDIVRIDNPYSTPPLPFEIVNDDARAALVNIICNTSTGGLHPISGSGVIIDSKGVVLTNAHVAQYVLIAQSGRSDLSCIVRSGSPAVGRWVPVVMYIPSVWVGTHAADIGKDHATSTGEHDFALLYLTETVDGSPPPAHFPALSPDTREAIGFVDDSVLAAGYPVEFLGGGTIEGRLYPLSSIATIRQLLTFSAGSADVISLGGILEAQSGSSGGEVVNQWDKVIGLVTTTSEGATTGSRDLHAITTGYIDRDLTTLTGKGLAATLAQDPAAVSASFLPTAAVLQQALFDAIRSARQ